MGSLVPWVPPEGLNGKPTACWFLQPLLSFQEIRLLFGHLALVWSVTGHAEIPQTIIVSAGSLRNHLQVLNFPFGSSNWHEEEKNTWNPTALPIMRSWLWPLCQNSVLV